MKVVEQAKRHLTLSGSSIINKQNEFENIISLFAFVVVAILLSKHALVRSYSSQYATDALALCGRGQRRTLRAQFSHVLRLRRSRFFLLRALAPQNFPSVVIWSSASDTSSSSDLRMISRCTLAVM